MTAKRLWETIKLVIFISLACLVIYWTVPKILAFGILWIADCADRIFNLNLSITIKARAGIYPFLYFRPELFVILALRDGWPLIEVFLSYWLFTTLMTTLTWLGTAESQKLFKKSGLAGKLADLSNRWLVFLTNRYSRYVIFVPFIFPIIPGVDVVAVVAGKLLKISFWVFIVLNLLKGITIMCLV